MTTWSFRARAISLLGCVLAIGAVALSGCGSAGDFPTAPVSGKVTYDGQPVTGGSITFAPISTGNELKVGQPASGVVQQDGTFVLGTQSENDGAVIGRHRVLYSPPAPEPVESSGAGGHSQAPPSPYAGLTPKEAEVEVQKGNNTFEIELIKG